MGGLWIESDTGDTYHFETVTFTEPKWILELLTDTAFLPICAAVFGLDLAPLQFIDYETSEVIDEADFWQNPLHIIRAATQLAHAFATTPNVFARLEAERQKQRLSFLNLTGFEDDILINSQIESDLQALATLAKQAQDDGAESIKLTGS